MWALEVIREEAYRPGARLSPPIHAQLCAAVNEVGHHIKKLFAYRYQVLPFIYTHLVSTLATFYLGSTAYLKGLFFEPDVSVVTGLSESSAHPIEPYCPRVGT